jgi:hypothetical protein
MDNAIIWILFGAWAASCIFYLVKIGRIAHSNRLSLFSPLRKYNRTLRIMVKKIYWRIILMTILFIIAFLITFYVRSSSMMNY